MADYNGLFSDIDERVAFSLEAEQSVLGAIILDYSCMAAVQEYLTPDCFYDRYNREVYSCALRMTAMSRPIDHVTLLEEIKEQKIFDSDADAKKYIAQLVDLVPAVANVESYAKIVQEKYYIRLLIATSREIIDTASAGGDDARNLLDYAEEKIYQIRQGKDAHGLKHIKDVILLTYDNLQRLTGDEKEKYLPMSSGFADLDRYTQGITKSNLIVIGARPGVGKTSFILNLAKNVALKYPEKDVVIFQLEMSADQLAMRLMAGEALIENTKITSGNLTAEEWKNLAVCSDMLSHCNIYIDDSTDVTVSNIKAKLRRLKNPGLIVIDYLQLMQSDRHIENRVNEVGEITRGLKLLAKEMNVPVILCAQLSRDSEKRNEHRPVLADLRESGSIEQDADQVYLLYKDPATETPEGGAIIEVNVAKNRHGGTGVVKFRWDGPHMRFFAVDRDEHEYD